ncbi:aldo/keto reductase [Dehalococcoides mccartyi]|jgi:aryl-alcohol dehydrogenase-like predicted oxidoreductase|uniref:aldo/keto reductase n=1 Tax=Dehalococcoides mccartyi TaxID=61435 RepID=UPI0003C833FD|nr:aldo/keto reductase [Dehalococcoides mccartyi]AHB13001.1 aldo/keto reductase oxidoreductase [Dehalococcoides mccartyi GY50]AII57459.1 aldo/keto reductase [Dehalococcoides mccartyi CG1]APH11954.1 aldo/keto reductase [Dehalococcoides mccartyi]
MNDILDKKWSYRELGKTGIGLSPIGLGGWQFSRGKGAAIGVWGMLNQTKVNEIVLNSLTGGINWFDTAEAYGMGQSEESLAEALKQAGIRPGECFIATKWQPTMRSASSLKTLLPIREGFLSPYKVDLYQVHFPGLFASIDTQMDNMAALYKEGRIRAIGVSNFNASQMRIAQKRLNKHGLSLASNQVKYNLLDRQIETNGVLETARELGISLIAYSPLGMGILSGKYQRNPEYLEQVPFIRRKAIRRGLEKSMPVIAKLSEIAVRYHADIAQAALAWVIYGQGDTVFALAGASTPVQARENLKALDIKLTTAEIAELNSISHF